MKLLKKILLRYRAMVDIEIRVEEISNGYLVNNRYFKTRKEVTEEISTVVGNPNILFEQRE